MSRRKMMCPFSGRPCRECPVYLGRHYHLCFSRESRRHLGDGEPTVALRSQFEGVPFRFELPPLPLSNPKWLAFTDFPERKEG